MALNGRLDTDDDALPKALRHFLRRRLFEITGLVLLAIVAYVLLALASWHVADPSLNHATRALPRNWLGYGGAAVADQLMQTIGLASLFFAGLPLFWVQGYFNHVPPRLLTGSVFWVLATLAAAAGLGCLTTPSGWPLSTGLGGNLGDILSGAITSLLSLALKGNLADAAAFVFLLASTVWLGLKAAGHGSTTAHGALSSAFFWSWSGLKVMLMNIWRGLAYVVRHKPRLHLPAFRLPLPQLRKTGRTEDDLQMSGDIITRLAPVRADGSRIRIEPAFGGGHRAQGPQLAIGMPGEDDDTADPLEISGDADDEDAEEEEVVAKPVRKVGLAPRAPRKGKSRFEKPPLDLLAEPRRVNRGAELSMDVLEENARELQGVLDDFSVKGQIINVRPGPVVTLYELEPAPGIKSSRVISLADDIARSMSAISARVAVVAGRNAIGIELPNNKRETVYLREMLAGETFIKSPQALCLALGKNIGGEPVFADLARMPHLLIAGTTGSGKSVGINTMILSLLYRLPPDRCKLIMIDPKMLELSVYEGIPHLLAPVVTDPRKAVVALKWAVREMEDRYKKMSKVGVRNVDGYNARMEQLAAKGEKLTRTVQTGFEPETGKPVFEDIEMDATPMPFIVVIIDEMADLMMVAGKDIEGAVQRLAQMARAAGIHVVMATQRPSVDVITGTIKANFPTRISFQVTSKIDSRTILGEQGAEQLLGQGDMLYMAGGGRISRLHAPFVSDKEVEDIVNHLKAQGSPEYVEAVTEEEDEEMQGDLAMPGGGSGDELYDQAVQVVLRDKKVSTSYIQRRLQIGYNKAASLIERMEQEGLISASNATGKREILVPGDSARE
jgi:S-DNA-T family DNA segregation ATPase FtsK/SpoIIIE